MRGRSQGRTSANATAAAFSARRRRRGQRRTNLRLPRRRKERARKRHRKQRRKQPNSEIAATHRHTAGSEATKKAKSSTQTCHLQNKKKGGGLKRNKQFQQQPVRQAAASQAAAERLSAVGKAILSHSLPTTKPCKWHGGMEGAYSIYMQSCSYIYEEKGTHPKPQKRNRNPKRKRARPNPFSLQKTGLLIHGSNKGKFKK